MVHLYVMVMMEVDETAFGIAELLAVVVVVLVMEAVSATCNAAAVAVG